MLQNPTSLKSKKIFSSLKIYHSLKNIFIVQRHPHGGGGAGPRSIPPRSSQGGHGTRGPSHGYGEGRGAQYYPKGKLVY